MKTDKTIIQKQKTFKMLKNVIFISMILQSQNQLKKCKPQFNRKLLNLRFTFQNRFASIICV